jgi:hypothetical protein
MVCTIPGSKRHGRYTLAMPSSHSDAKEHDCISTQRTSYLDGPPWAISQLAVAVLCRIPAVAVKKDDRATHKVL